MNLDLELHGVVQEQRLQGPEPLHRILGAHQGMALPVTGCHTGDSAAVRLQPGAAASLQVHQCHLATDGSVEQPAVRQEGHGGQRSLQEREREDLQGALHRGDAVHGHDLEEAHAVLVGHSQVLLLGAGSQAHHPAEALWGGDAQGLLGKS